MTDANGLRFWLLSEESDWIATASAPGQPPPEYDAAQRTFRLGRYAAVAFEETPNVAETRWALPRTVMDAHGTYAFFDGASGQVRGAGSVPGSATLHTPGAQPRDMAVTTDGILCILDGSDLELIDLRSRWTIPPLTDAELVPVRVATGQGGAIWLLDRVNRRLAVVRGRPYPERGLRVRAPDAFVPHEENLDPPRIELVGPQLDAAETPVDIAISARGRVAVLLWRGPTEALVRFVGEEGALSAAHVLEQVEQPYALAWVDDETLAVMVASEETPPGGGPAVPSSDIVTYLAELSDTDTSRPPLGGIYPLPGHDLAPFVRTVGSPPYYAVTPDADPMRRPRKLIKVSATFHAARGVLATPDSAPLDSGQVGFVWHRAYLEASLPPSSGVRLLAAASDDLTPPADDGFEHVFGDLAAARGVPRGVWTNHASELAFHPGVLPCPPQPHHAGAFTVLLQRSDRRVSALSGRYLWLRLELEGNGQATPEIAALRVYGNRFSYVRNYLPRVFHEQLVAPESDLPLAEGGRSQADFLERFLSNFEGVLTPLEDRIANAHLLTDPGTVPEESLDWLGSWVGLLFDAAYPAQHRREALRHTMLLHRWRGTARGMQLALDILTGGTLVDGEMVGGAVTQGQVVLLEGWRLRRTFTTILGLDLSRRDDPLLVGVVRSGNSIVGDSLILGEPHRLEFLALLRRMFPGDGPPQDASVAEWITWYIEEYLDEHAVQPFLDQLAHRLLVLIHEDADQDLVGLVQRVASLEAPVHLETDVTRATYPFMVGLASLVGVDTFLRPPPPKAAIVVDQSRLGERGRLSRPAALDPRLEGGGS